MKTTLGAIRRADEEYGMIQPGDKVCVGVSGGKDSLLLLQAMSLYRRVRHEDFELCAVMLLTGKERVDTSAIEALADECHVPLMIRQTELYEILFEIRKDPNPCALCAKMRRAMLCDASKEMGANKLALGHHRDDALETLVMSLLYEGRIHTFHPCSYMSRSQLTVIRPMIFLPEKHVIHMQRELNLPVMNKVCPVDGHTKRQEMKELLDDLCRRYPTAREMMLRALRNHDQYGLWAPADAQKDVRGCKTKVIYPLKETHTEPHPPPRSSDGMGIFLVMRKPNIAGSAGRESRLPSEPGGQLPTGGNAAERLCSKQPLRAFGTQSTGAGRSPACLQSGKERSIINT